MLALVGLVMWAARVSPEQVESNLSGWIRKFGINNPPEWLRNKIFDRRVTIISTLTLCVLIIIGGSMFHIFPTPQFILNWFTLRPSQPAHSLDSPNAATDISVIYPPPTSAKQNPDGKERIFVDVSPDQFGQLFVGRTDAEAQRSIEPYIGKWMALSGSVYDVSILTHPHDTTAIVQLYRKWPLGANLPMAVELIFPSRSSGRANILRVGSSISAACKISNVSRIDIKLTQCEFVN